MCLLPSREAVSGCRKAAAAGLQWSAVGEGRVRVWPGSRLSTLHVGRRILLAMVAGLLMGFLPLVFLRTEPAAATVRPGFEDRLVASTGDGPMGLAFTPDGRMLIPLKKGQVRVYENGQLLQTPALNISSRICGGHESGLLGIALDPDFGTAGHNYVYLFYTFNKFGVCPTDWNPDNPVNRVSRFAMSGDTIDPSSEEVLIDNIPSPTADELYGQDGNDALDSRDGVSGNDSLDGGAGTDTRVTDPTEKSIVGFP